jgi:hypothetical protein
MTISAEPAASVAGILWRIRNKKDYCPVVFDIASWLPPWRKLDYHQQQYEPSL